ncbi:MAG: NUDIX hydrolase [Rhodothalassiaceae bacterium]
MRRPVIGVGVVVFKHDQVLLIRRGTPPKQHQWSLPGGKQEWGETVPAAAHREVFEETGVTIHLGPLIDIVDLIERDETGELVRHYTLLDYAATWRSGTPCARDDAADARFWPLDAVNGLGLWHETARVIHQAWDRLA